MPGTPSERAGLPVGSEIAGINGIATKGMTMEDAVKLMRGPVGTRVMLDVRTACGAGAKVELIREKIVLGKP